MAKPLGAINLERETKCRTAITFVIVIMTVSDLCKCSCCFAWRIASHKQDTLHKKKTVKRLFVFGIVCFKQKCKTITKVKQKRQLFTKSLSLLLSSPFKTQISLLCSMLDCNQNVSCQLSVVKRCFSIVDLIKFCMSLACTC